VVLALGGGPQATTLELAIYQALKYDFNLPEALTLAWVQFTIAGTLFALLGRLGGGSWLVLEQGGSQVPVPGRWGGLWHGGVYLLCALFLLLPLLVLLPVLAHIPASLRLLPLLQALWNSLLLALACAVPATLLAWLVLWPQRLAQLQGRHRRRQLLEWLSTHALTAPAMVLSVGWYVFALPRLRLEHWGPVLVVLLNLALTLPFAVQQLRPRLLQFDAQYAPLCAGLKLAWQERLTLEWRWLGGSLRAAFALALLLAMGDVAVFALFGDKDWTTLPWLIYRYASTYRMQEAALASLLLLGVCGLLVWVLERERAHA
ncbi:MAG: thiamine/thiamine pyrophosphate ABC transporter permease ThiP, partial [Thiothrix sp.]|nr:thiamine/thiamine pyrophosphate ABC transporter permease ThiP [Thiothrix sp.]